ncbi:MAG: lactate dehydrogenase [Methanoregula sp.]|jgi:malate dehydrogenase|uniref:malate dehydrogenase n=1 Tax=Methanoregula sp. TaxID=2052170 RepID=UPI0025DB5DD1|nr:lactate dehydrogenase [Methanoregula sp.]MCK9632175.1 lactate dehydrogenase [Methanoregula sp.]
MARLAVVGVGRIGGEVAYLAASLGIVDELVLYDTAPDLLRAQVLDLQHTGLDISISTGMTGIRDADLCVFSAGLPRNPSVKTRADLLDANMAATCDCAGLLKGFSGVLITVTNPMDVNNFYLCKKTGLPRERCIGFGGQLDSARFGLAISERNIDGLPFVLGEHGEHQVPVFSRLDAPVGETVREEILRELRGASMKVITGKGGTVFGPALHLARLARMVLSNTGENTVCSAVLDGEYGLRDCSLGVPVRIGREGIMKITEWELDPWEKAKMDEAGQFVTGLCKKAVP